jgi:hypothetical protein
MARGVVTSAALLLFGACTSIETGVISDADYVGVGGAPQGIVQVTTVGFSLFFGLVDVVGTDIDTTTKLLVAEAKAMDGTKVEIKSVHTSPRHGVFKLLCALVCFPSTEVVGVAIKQ